MTILIFVNWTIFGMRVESVDNGSILLPVHYVIIEVDGGIENYLEGVDCMDWSKKSSNDEEEPKRRIRYGI